MNIVGSHNSILKVRELISKASKVDSTVLILGESGTGKELVAKNIHYFSARKNNSFLPINSGAIPHELLESELFGYDKGAFTGANFNKKGKFELADKGSIFLDEIGDMPYSMQVKLLRVLQDKHIDRIGSTNKIKVDVRIIAATNQSLQKLSDEGKFRQDLFFRLNIFPISLPPLRKRIKDLPVLIDFFSNQIKQNNQPVCFFDEKLIKHFSDYHWPGNIRELYNVIERLSILYPDKNISVIDLPNDILLSSVSSVSNECTKSNYQKLKLGNFSLKRYIEQIEKDYIVLALENSSKVVAKAAKSLGLNRTTLVEKMKKYNIF